MVQLVEKISKAEAIKQQSRQLRGHLARDLADTATPFDGEGYSLLKFHGIYQGYDRDTATALKQQGLDKRHEFMARIKAPGGMMTAEQYLAVDELEGVAPAIAAWMEQGPELPRHRVDGPDVAPLAQVARGARQREVVLGGRAAVLLGITRDTLRYKMKKFNLR